MNMNDDKIKVFKRPYYGEKAYWIVYKANDFGEPLWVCNTFEEAWELLTLSMGEVRENLGR